MLYFDTEPNRYNFFLNWKMDHVPKCNILIPNRMILNNFIKNWWKICVLTLGPIDSVYPKSKIELDMKLQISLKPTLAEREATKNLTARLHTGQLLWISNHLINTITSFKKMISNHVISLNIHKCNLTSKWPYFDDHIEYPVRGGVDGGMEAGRQGVEG